MKSNCSLTWAPVVLAFVLIASFAQAAAPATPQGLVTGKAFYNLTGTAMANLTNAAKFPNNPDALFFFPYFEWAATGDIATPPANFADNYGGQIVGYFYPPATGDYTFWLAADDNARLYLSTDSTPGNKKEIAQETAWSNFREYQSSGGNSVLASKDSSQFAATQWPTKDPNTGGAKITLQAGQAYYIEALFKEGGGGDNLSVAVLDPGQTIDFFSPIPGQYLSSDRTGGAVSIATQPQSSTVAERGSATFSVLANGTPPYTYQWRKNGTAIADATNLTLTVTSATVADNNAKYSVVVTGAQGTVPSQDAVLTVTPDTTLPTVLNAKASPNRTEVVVTFSEGLDQTSATAIANYQISSSSGPLNVTGATLSGSGTQVTLTTAQQTLGTKYTLLVSNVKDSAATPNTIAANSKAVFFPTGKLVEQNGFIVFEAENFDRNLDDIWVRDTTRGTPSGGASVVAPNGAGGSEASTKLEYDVEFKQAATYTIWYRASGNDGADDSSWFHIDGERPVERANANDAAMTGFSGQLDFVWRTDSFGGVDPMSVDIATPGVHVVGLARREDGSFFDKFILTTVTPYTPTGLGPAETREGAPGLPTISVSAPTEGQTFAVGANVTLSATAAGQSGLEITKVEFTANGTVIGEDTASPFTITWSNPAAGIYSVRARAIDEINQVTSSAGATVTIGTPPPQALFLVGTDSDPNLNASDTGVKARLESMGFQVTVVQAPASTTANADGKQLIVVSATVNSGDVGDKFRASAVPVLAWEQAVQDNFLMTLDTATDHATIAGQTSLNIVKADHPLAAGLSTGVKIATTAAQDYSLGVPNANAVIIATVADNPAQALIYGYDKGAILADGSTPAPARRVMFLWGNNGFAASTDDVLKLFDAAVVWASGITPKPRKTGNIVWVSFHEADDTPDAVSAGVGMTVASDRGYTALLRSQGYTVTRYLTTATPDAAFLNAADLVIISRAAPSGNYQNAGATEWSTTITKPMIILGGYVLRANRMGFTTGDTIPDTTGDIRLNVSSPTHPIFTGIALDANKTMVNVYAGIESFFGQDPPLMQRGISVSTTPLAGGGKVLATVGSSTGTTDTTIGGTIIGEWTAGSTLGNAAADVLAGKRLVFLSGSREAAGFTGGNAAGFYDLEPDGEAMFLNAVSYMLGQAPTPAPTVSVSRTPTGVSISFTGTLQSATSITGPWTDEAGATSPLTVTAPQGLKFYRAKQ